MELFSFAFLFSSYCRSVDVRVVFYVSGGYNQSFSVIFYVVFEELCRCVNAIFNADKSYSSLPAW